MEQRTDDWVMARLGKATASKVADIVARTKTGWGASRANYAAQLIAERLTGKQQETYTNAAMQWGTDTEPMARDAYAFLHDTAVEEVGFVPHPRIPMSGGSPDGLVGIHGGIEIKCPNTATHLDFLLNSTVEKKYLLQMQWCMACTDRKWWDFVSFDPRLPPALQMKVVRVLRDNALLAELESDIVCFLEEIDSKVAKLQALSGLAVKP